MIEASALVLASAVFADDVDRRPSSYRPFSPSATSTARDAIVNWRLEQEPWRFVMRRSYSLLFTTSRPRGRAGTGSDPVRRPRDGTAGRTCAVANNSLRRMPQ